VLCTVRWVQIIIVYCISQNAKERILNIFTIRKWSIFQTDIYNLIEMLTQCMHISEHATLLLCIIFMYLSISWKINLGFFFLIKFIGSKTCSKIRLAYFTISGDGRSGEAHHSSISWRCLFVASWDVLEDTVI
jgi:hypothetical protein